MLKKLNLFKCVMLSLLTISCSIDQTGSPEEFRNRITDTEETNQTNLIPLPAREGQTVEDEFTLSLIDTENSASEAAKAVLSTARQMVTDSKIIVGSCWDYVNSIYDSAGFPSYKRKQIFKSKKAGPYAEVEKISSGDWLYFRNRSYNNVEHSAVFVHWVDEAKKIALMVSYAGGDKKVPGRYKTYELTGVYSIIRSANN